MPLLTVLKAWKKSTLLALLVNMVHSSFSFIIQIFVLGYAVRQYGTPQNAVTSGIMIANVVEIAAMPIIAKYSDRFGRRPFIIAGIVLMAIWFPIDFQIIQQKDVMLIIIGLVVAMGLCHGTLFGAEAAFTAELFPTEVRVSGSSLGKQLGVILGGGIAPLVATSLMGATGGNLMSVIIYFEAMAVLAFIAVLFAPESFKRAL
jgi:MFS family permease